MKKEISPELYNYNKFPGPEFRLQGDEVVASGIAFTLLHNSGRPFDSQAFSQRYSDFLRQYDYLVGDWGNEQLRLKGFYKSKKKALASISRLDEYLKEYCNFGCDYFVLENPAPKAMSYKEDKREPRKKQRQRKPNTYRDNRQKSSYNQRTCKQNNFTIRKKENL